MPRVGWIEWDPNVVTGEVYVVWPDALDVPEDKLRNVLALGAMSAEDMAPPARLASYTDDAGSVDAPVTWRTAQVMLARYHWTRAQSASNDLGNAEYGIPDASRKMWLDARDLIRPRRGLKGIF